MKKKKTKRDKISYIIYKTISNYTTNGFTYLPSNVIEKLINKLYKIK